MSLTERFHILVIDDDPLIIESIRMLLPKHWQMTSYLKADFPADRMIFHAAFVDMHLSPNPKAEGPQIIHNISSSNPNIEIVAMSGDLSLDLMEKCLQNGAKKFLAKPLMPDEFLSNLEKIEALWTLRLMEARGANPQFIGSSPEAENVRNQIAQLRGEPGPILIEGETGCGKEVVAHLLNKQELNRHFLTVNIASLSENLFESEIFGHVKGAFTGAESNKVGLAEAAHGGDLFLDEIEALPLNQQVKLLRFLESGEIRKVGGKDNILVKTRVLVASNQNLQQLVKEGKFREDLYFRLAGKKISLPPLRERLSDLDKLAPYFLQMLKPRSNKVFSPEGILALQNYRWPGNVRELKRICEQLALTSPLPILRADDVRRILGVSASPSSVDANVDLTQGLAKAVENFEARSIRQALTQTADIDQAAELLKMSRSNLYKKIKDYEIEVS